MVETTDIADLGPVQKTFRGSRANAVAGIILGLIMIVGGGFGIVFNVRDAARKGWHMPFLAEKGNCWAAFTGINLLCAGLAIGGGYLITFMPRMLSKRACFFCANGFYVVASGQTKVFAWSDISLIEEMIFHEKLPVRGVVGALLPQSTSVSYVVENSSGQREPFSKESIEGIDALERLLRQEAAARNIPWNVIEHRT